MRKILFRGKALDGIKWVKGDIIRAFGLIYVYLDDGIEDANLYEVDPKTVEQYSGVDDKNGVQIFEGDLVSGLFRHGQEIVGICAFGGGAFGILCKYGDSERFTPFTSTCNIEWTVVGNFHDNPELIGE